MKPLYYRDNCTPSYQLRWSLALFAIAPLPSPSEWIDSLRDVIEQDRIRLLEHSMESNVVRLLLSTQPSVAPSQIVKLVKGRLQHLLKDYVPKAFRRNFSLTSIGDAHRTEIESYVSSQLGHHPLTDRRVEQRFQAFQFAFIDVDPLAEQFSSHGRYIYGLHLVLVNDARWREIREDRLVITRDMFFKTARKKSHRVSRLAILPDHLHATLGCNFGESPEEVAFGYMNNLAFAQGMREIFSFSYYTGTFGNYNMQAVRRRL
jgi:REP element-mobilizing transposase RayT